MDSKNTKTITLTLPKILVTEIDNKRGSLSRSLAFKILTQTSLANIPGPLIQNIPLDEKYSGEK